MDISLPWPMELLSFHCIQSVQIQGSEVDAGHYSSLQALFLETEAEL